METNKRRELREAIVTASLQLASEVGEEGVTMRGIAKRLGISATAIYQHFDGKAAIMAAIRLRGMHSLLHEIEAAFSHDELFDCLRDMTRRYVHFARVSPWLYGVLMQSGDPLEQSMVGDELEDLSAVRGQIANRMATKFSPLVAGDRERITTLVARLWCATHGIASLLIGGRLNTHHPIVPIQDMEAFVEDYSTAIVNSIMTDIPMPHLAANTCAGPTRELGPVDRV